MNDVHSFLQSLQESTKEYLKMFYNRSITNNSHITSHVVFPSLKTIKIIMNELKVGLMNTCQKLIFTNAIYILISFSATEKR